KYFSKILNNNYQNIALTKLRDTLLPKLISGELSLEDLPDLTTDTEAA
ncbi:TPA: restriction endonuclease subunit S, partial [Escherichia coli]